MILGSVNINLMHRYIIGFIINHITIKWDWLWKNLWTLLIAMTNNLSENIWDECMKTSKIGPLIGLSKLKC